MAEAVVLASGSGSNFEAITRRVRSTNHTMVGLVCDQPQAYCLQRARALGVQSWVVRYLGRRTAAEQELSSLLTQLDPDLVVLAGFMKVLPEWLVDRWQRRIVNIHPSLLPAYPGLRAIERSFASQDKELGITIHFVDAGVDTGPVIEQHSIRRDTVPDVATAFARIHELEHRYYPEVVVRLLDRHQATSQGDPS